MERKKVGRCPATGRTVERYESLGRGKAVPARGRPQRSVNSQIVGPVRQLGNFA